MTAEDWEEAVEALRPNGDGLRVDLEDIPEVMPLWSGFFTDREGRLWVQRFLASRGRSYRMRTWEL